MRLTNIFSLLSILAGLLFIQFSWAEPSPQQFNPCDPNYSANTIQPYLVDASLATFNNWSVDQGITLSNSNTTALIPTASGKSGYSMTATIPASDFSKPYGIYTLQMCVKTNAYDIAKGKPLASITVSTPDSNIGNDPNKWILQKSIIISYENFKDIWEVYRITFFLNPGYKQSGLPIKISFPPGVDGCTDANGNPQACQGWVKNFGVFDRALPTVPVSIKNNIIGSPYFSMDQNKFLQFWPNAIQPASSSTGDGSSSVVSLPSSGLPTPPLVPTDSDKKWSDLDQPGILKIVQPKSDVYKEEPGYHVTVDSTLIQGNVHQKSELQNPNQDYLLTAEVYVKPGSDDADYLKSLQNIFNIYDNNEANANAVDKNSSDYQPVDPSITNKWQLVKIPFHFDGQPSGTKLQMSLYNFQYGSGDTKSYPPGTIYITSMQIQPLPTGTSRKTVKATTVPLISDFKDFTSGQTLDPNKWLLPRRSVGSATTQDHAGVFPNNVTLTNDNVFEDPVNKKGATTVLRLHYFGGDDSSPIQQYAWGDTFYKEADDNGYSRKERQGGAIVSNPYYDSATYLMCVRFPYDSDATTADITSARDDGYNWPHKNDTGGVSAFWPYNYVDLQPGQPDYDNQPTKIRNYEVDWEIPGYNQDNNGPWWPVSYNFARLNSWGSQWGEVDNMTGRPGNPTPGNNHSLSSLNVYPTTYNSKQFNIAHPLDDGKFHQVAIVINSGGIPDQDTGLKQGGYNYDPSNGGKPHPRGYIAWYFNKDCVVQQKLRQMQAPDGSGNWLQYYSNRDSSANEAAMRKVLSPMVNPEDPSYNGDLGNLVQIKTADAYDLPNVAMENDPSKNILSGQFLGNSYGYDNVPKRAMRFWIGIWSPGALAYNIATNMVNSDGTLNTDKTRWGWGWGGTPDYIGESQFPDGNQCVTYPLLGKVCSVADFRCNSTNLRAKNPDATDPSIQTPTDWCTTEFKYDQSIGDNKTLSFDPNRVQFLKDWLSEDTESVKNPVRDGYTDPDSGHHFTNERDLDLESVIIFPTSDAANATHPDTTSTDPEEWSNNFLCQDSSKSFPAGCNPDKEGRIFTKADKYPSLGNVNPAVFWPSDGLPSSAYVNPQGQLTGSFNANAWVNNGDNVTYKLSLSGAGSISYQGNGKFSGSGVSAGETVNITAVDASDASLTAKATPIKVMPSSSLPAPTNVKFYLNCTNQGILDLCNGSISWNQNTNANGISAVVNIVGAGGNEIPGFPKIVPANQLSNNSLTLENVQLNGPGYPYLASIALEQDGADPGEAYKAAEIGLSLDTATRKSK